MLYKNVFSELNRSETENGIQISLTSYREEKREEGDRGGQEDKRGNGKEGDRFSQ